MCKEMEVRKGTALRKMRFFRHKVRRDGFEKTIEQRRMEGKRSRRRWTGPVETPVTTMANSRDGWRAIEGHSSTIQCTLTKRKHQNCQ